MMTPTTPAAESGGLGAAFDQASGWLDRKGRGAWIAAMILGFVLFWPVGLAILLYMTFTNRWSRSMFASSCHRSRHEHRAHWGHFSAQRSSGNTAFDAYKTETLRRLEEEQRAFEAFLDRLRQAKDKSEFDTFMTDRARAASETPEAMPPAPPAGGAAGPVPQSY